ncbi:cytochrome c biogenesis protein CcsA [Oryzisolibacter sp. LB2S]|uniref:cytochrome C assembly family protein n=1 Tax=Alicycliphilus soli TaxID=3228789 RepID=UPI003458B207
MILPSASPSAWLLALVTAAAYVLGAAVASRGHGRRSHLAMAPAWGLHAITIVWSQLGNTPHFGFAAALSMTAWLVLTIYALERELFPQMRARWALGALGGVAVLLAAVFPGRPLHVTASPWMPLHLTLGIACYGLFAAAVAHAWLMSRAEQQMRQAVHLHSSLPLLTLERLTFRFVRWGFALLSATLVVGWLFSEQLYGRAWLWDHKAVFSVLAWIAFAVLLLGRARFGWRGRSAVRMVYAGAMLLLLAYVGSRFVLEVVLRRPG